mmetsp:Transcript_26080/g.53153  ORF Transcript_26080/g.53153 Transcript_26080/m.53153 type:complete len:173 (+) Transcript_26080:528-1046(+)
MKFKRCNTSFGDSVTELPRVPLPFSIQSMTNSQGVRITVGSGVLFKYDKDNGDDIGDSEFGHGIGLVKSILLELTTAGQQTTITIVEYKFGPLEDVGEYFENNLSCNFPHVVLQTDNTLKLPDIAIIKAIVLLPQCFWGDHVVQLWQYYLVLGHLVDNLEPTSSQDSTFHVA